MRNFHTHYDNLKVSFHATPEAIQQAYRRLSMRHHPDRNPGNEHANSIMAIINQSYRVLSDPFLRAEHDRWIEHRARNHGTPPHAPRPTDPPPAYQEQAAGPVHTHPWRFIIANSAGLAWLALILMIMPILGSISGPPPTTTLSGTKLAPLRQDKIIHPIAPTISQATPDVAGTYRLLKYDYTSYDDSPITYLKGKLVIQKLSDSAYLFLEAKTVKGARTFGDGYIYRLQPSRTGDARGVFADGCRSAWAASNGPRLEIHVQGVNYAEVSYWERADGSFSEKYLDRGIKEAAEIQKQRQPILDSLHC